MHTTSQGHRDFLFVAPVASLANRFSSWKRAPRGALNATQLLGHKGPTGAFYSDVIGDQCGRLPRGSSLASAAVRQQPRLLPQRHDPTWPALHCFIECSPRNPVVTGKGDQLLDVAIVVVPKLDGIRKIIRPPHSHAAMGEQNANCVKGRRGSSHCRRPMLLPACTDPGLRGKE